MCTEQIKVRILGQSEKGLKVSYLGKYVWLPKSEIERMVRDANHAVITIPFWLYNKHWD